MSTNTRPRICEVLGVEVGERFTIDGYPTDYGQVQVCEDGKVRRVLSDDFAKIFDQEVGHKIGANALYYLLSHPECILRQPSFTADEVADMAAIQRIFRSAVVGRLENSNVYTSNRAMSLNEAWSSEDRITYLPERLFPSVLPGQSVTISEVIKNEKEK